MKNHALMQNWAKQINDMAEFTDETVYMQHGLRNPVEISENNWLPLTDDDLIIYIYKNQIYVGSVIDGFGQPVNTYDEVNKYVNDYYNNMLD
jgi:hypothetical protein